MLATTHPWPPSLSLIRVQTPRKCIAFPSFVVVSPSADGFLFAHSIPVLTDINIVHDELDASLFPGVSSSVQVHDGFSTAHESCVLALRWFGNVLLVCL